MCSLKVGVLQVSRSPDHHEAMKVSVIIPFYNAAGFLMNAVKSALDQKETGEIILVDDGSIDQSGILAGELAQKHHLVKFYQHPDPGRPNLGPAAARNTGISMVTFPLVAFLDADDQYLSHRFTRTVELFQSNENIQVVYGATLNEFKSKALRQTYKKIYGSEIDQIYLNPSGSQSTFASLALAKNGFIHLNSLTVRTSTLKKVGLFNESLRQMQDTDLILRLALISEFYALPPVPPLARRIVHGTNAVFNRKSAHESRLKFLLIWINKSREVRAPLETTFHFLRSYLGEHPFSGRGKFNMIKTFIRKFTLLIRLLLKR